MAKKLPLSGLATVMKNLNKEVADIEDRTMAGMLAAGFDILRLAQQRVPREYGVLMNSGYCRPAQNVPNAVEIGFSAEYAVYVHENMQQKLAGKPRPSGLGVYWGPAGRPKFLESAVTDLHDKTLDTIQSYARVK